MNVAVTQEAPVRLKKAARPNGKTKYKPAREEPPHEPVCEPQPNGSPEAIEAMIKRPNLGEDTDFQSATPSDPPDSKQEEPIFPTPEVIVEIARQEGTEFFHDQFQIVHAWIRKRDGDRSHFECLRIRSHAFKARLLEMIKSKTKILPSRKDLKEAIETFEIQAFESNTVELDNRRTAIDDEILIDMGDPEWGMVVINRRGWQLRGQDRPRFYRPLHMRPLPVPVGGGDVMKLFDFVPVESDDEKLLLLTWIVTAVYAAVPNPILLLAGRQGSAKTTRSRRLRSLLDPSVTPVLGEIQSSRLYLTFQNHAVPCFENVSNFKRNVADMLCRAVTGNGVERRKLYTDADSVLYSFQRSIIVNGITTPSTRPDFLERCLIINCRRMDTFVTLRELDQQFEAARPRLFGAILDFLVKILALLDTTPAATEFRMADFAHIGRAVAVALGKQPNEFDDAYRQNIWQRDIEVLEDAPMTRVLKAYAMKFTEDEPWIGTMELLLDALRNQAKDAGDKLGQENLPKSASKLSTRLGEMESALAAEGVFVVKLNRTNGRRPCKVFYKSPFPK